MRNNNKYKKPWNIQLHSMLVLAFVIVLSSVGAIVINWSTKNISYINVNNEEPVSFAENTSYAVSAQILTNNFTFDIQSIRPELALNVISILFVAFILFVSLAIYKVNGNISLFWNVFVNSLFNRTSNIAGVVFNLANNAPVAFAKVSVLQKQAGPNSVVQAIPIYSAVTDTEGRYSLNIEPSKNLSLEVQSLGYSSVIKSFASNQDIGLKPMVEDKFYYKVLSINKKILFRALRIVVLILSILGYAFTVFKLVNEVRLSNLLLMGIYALIFIIAAYPSLYRIFLKRVVVVDQAGNVIKGAIVRIYKDKEFINLNVTDKKGVARFNLSEGIYNVNVSKSGYNYLKTEIEFDDELNTKQEIPISKKSFEEDVLSNDLDLHDQVMQTNHEKFNLQ